MIFSLRLFHYLYLFDNKFQKECHNDQVYTNLSIIIVSMNIYNLEDFKCFYCKSWFHPQQLQPYQLSCKHSICFKCLHISHQHNKKYITCPQHKTQNPLNEAQFNNKIIEALKRLMKNVKQNKTNESEDYSKKFNEFIKNREKDIKLFGQFLDQIYNNQINRLLYLKRRIKLQIQQPLFGINQWKSSCKRQKGFRENIQEGNILLQKIKQYNQLNFEEISQSIIKDSTVCLQRNFSIYNLVHTKIQKNTLKLSAKQQDNLRSYYIPADYGQLKENKQNNFINLAKSMQVSQEKSSNLCKELSSFKLQEDYPQSFQYTYINDFTKNKDEDKKSNLKEYLSQTNQLTTLRDFQCSKISHKPKKSQLQNEKKRSYDNFNELINSLKMNQLDSFEDNVSILQYSFDQQPVEDQMLLSTTKDYNFLKEFQIEKPEKHKNIEIKHRQLINSDKQKNKYIKKLQTIKTQKACQKTTIHDNTLELFNIDLKQIDLKGYLDKIKWSEIVVIKMVGTCLQDHQLNILLNYMVHSQVNTLLLPNNDLQQISLDALIRFIDLNSHLKTISLQKNNIQVLSGNCKAKIALIRKKGITLYI